MADLELNSIGNGDGNNYLLRDNSKIPLSGSNQISGDLIPATDNAIDVGSSTNNIKMLYTKGITIDNKTIDTDANGNMTFNSHIVNTIEEQGDGYIRYTNGIQICWGLGEYSNNNTITYPRTFIAANTMSVQVNCGITNVIVGATNWFAASFMLSISVANAWVSWLAIGRWK